MKKIILIAIILSASLLTYSQDLEKEAIKNVIQTAYVEGLQNEGDQKKIESGFHPDFSLLIIGEGDEMRQYPISEWKSRQVNRRNAGELPLSKDKKVSVKFLNVDVSGSAAVVKLEFYIGDKLSYIDYISLYKFESGWRIVSKIFEEV